MDVHGGKVATKDSRGNLFFYFLFLQYSVMKYKSLYTTYSVVWKPKKFAFICRAETSGRACNSKQTLSMCVKNMFVYVCITITTNNLNVILYITKAFLYAVIHDRHSFDSVSKYSILFRLCSCLKWQANEF